MFKFLGMCFLLLVAYYGYAEAASFDCSKAVTNNETLICTTPELSKLDEVYAKLYRQAKAKLPDVLQTKQEAISAFKQRGSVCKDSECLNAWYRYRIFVLEIKLSNVPLIENSQPQTGPSTSGAVLDCSHAYTTLDMNQCSAREVGAAKEVMNGYLEKSIERYSDDPTAQNGIENSQGAWEAFRDAHCGAVYDIWRDGTIRTVLYLSCELDMVQRRTSELWESFLTSVDSTPSKVPEPFPVLATGF